MIVKELLSKAELVTHPVRLRIIDAVSLGEATPRQIAQRLSDVPQATLYRQIKILDEGGLLEIVSQRQVRGVTESTYRLVRGSTRLSREEFASMTPDEHLACHAMLFGQAAGTLERYFSQPDFDTSNDGMTYFSAKLMITDEDARQLRVDLLELMEKYSSKATDVGRGRRVTISSFPETRP